jgi:hypothetical protein
MKSRSWRDVAEFIGIAAIVISLIFVGLQVRQDHQIARAQANTDFNSSQIEIANLLTTNGKLWGKGLSGEELTLEEEIAFEAIVHVVDTKYQAMAVRAAHLGGRPSLEISRQYAMHIFIHPGFRRVWKKRCDYYREIDGSEIPPCIQIQRQLDAMENGTALSPTIKIWSL